MLASNSGERTIPCLTIKQPWAWLIMAGIKTVENRRRPSHYRGRLGIHAGQGVDPAGLALLAEIGIELPADLPAGVILGTVQLVDCESIEQGSLFANRIAQDRFRTGPYCLIVSDPEPLPNAIVARGNLGFWRVPARLFE